VIGTAACNSQHPSGCAASPAVQAVGCTPDTVNVSSNGATVYVANSANDPNGLEAGGNSLSLINAMSCRGGHPQGCSQSPAPVASIGNEAFDQPQSLAIDSGTDSLYAANSGDDSVSVVDVRACNALHVSGCPRPGPSVQSGAEPVAVATLPREHTVYVVDGSDGAVAVIDDRACSGTQPAACRPAPVPTALMGSYHALVTGSAVDAADHTAYELDYGQFGLTSNGVIDLINTSKCNAATQAGCTTPPPSFTPGSNPNGAVIDPTTDTLYIAEGGIPGEPNQLEVIAAAHCSATNMTGCASSATTPLGGPAGFVGIDDATHTVYVAGISTITVVDASHCNATDMTGCGSQPLAHISTSAPAVLAVAPDTLYAAIAPGFGAPGVVDVIDTRHCRAADTSQCATMTPPSVAVGLGPADVVFDSARNTAYVTDNANGEGTGLLAMINTTHCNGDDSSGCATQPSATTPTGRAPLLAGLDPSTGTLYVTNFSDASVFLYDTANCNAAAPSGCPKLPPEVIVGNGPDDVALDPTSHTIYVPDFLDGTVSLVRTGQ